MIHLRAADRALVSARITRVARRIAAFLLHVFRSLVPRRRRPHRGVGPVVNGVTLSQLLHVAVAAGFPAAPTTDCRPIAVRPLSGGTVSRPTRRLRPIRDLG